MVPVLTRSTAIAVTASLVTLGLTAKQVGPDQTDPWAHNIKSIFNLRSFGQFVFDSVGLVDTCIGFQRVKA